MVDVSWMWAQVITAMEVLAGPRLVFGAVGPASCTLARCWLSAARERRRDRAKEPADSGASLPLTVSACLGPGVPSRKGDRGSSDH